MCYFYTVILTYSSDPIPVKPYVKKFIEEGNSIKPYVLDMIYTLFQKSPVRDQLQFSFECCIKLQLPQKVFETNGWVLNRKNVVIFNRALEGYIKDRFECELEANIHRSIKQQEKFHIQEMILDLRKKFGLDEDIFPFETIKKSLQRFCERENIDLQEIKIFSKYVPKKQPLITVNHNLVKSIDFIESVGIHPNTFTAWRKRGIVYAERKGRYLHVDITKSNLPTYIQFTCTNHT